MRLLMAAILLGAVALPLSACDREATDEAQKVVETPKRKPGMWKQVTGIQGIGGIPAVHICLDEATDKKLAWWGQQGVRGGCAENDISKNADGTWSFDSICESPDGVKTTTRGVATGDFDTSYRIDAESTTVGAPNAEMNGTHHVIIDATWVGDCPNGVTPGDMQLPDGTLVNLVQMTGG
jgi:hypothetical protein